MYFTREYLIDEHPYAWMKHFQRDMKKKILYDTESTLPSQKLFNAITI